MKPFRLIASGKDYIWGGTRLKSEFGKDFMDMEPLAETWECSVHPDGPSFAGSGEHAGMTLAALVSEHPEILGRNVHELPSLVKFIDARDDLSVQVHPDDDYARSHEKGQNGKTEMWYVVEAEEGASLVFGLTRRLNPEMLRMVVESGKLERYLNRVPVHKNDVFFIPAGTIHAIGKGVVIAEIQQNSNLTYRLYDYNRAGKDGKLRELHVDKAVAVSNLEGKLGYRQHLRVLHYNVGYASELLGKCRSFEVYRWLVHSEEGVTLPDLPESFRHVLCVSGRGSLGELGFKKGDGIFVPAACGDLELRGHCELLITRG